MKSREPAKSPVVVKRKKREHKSAGPGSRLVAAASEPNAYAKLQKAPKGCASK